MFNYIYKLLYNISVYEGLFNMYTLETMELLLSYLKMTQSIPATKPPREHFPLGFLNTVYVLADH